MTTHAMTGAGRAAVAVLAAGAALLAGFGAMIAAFWGAVSFTGCFIDCDEPEVVLGVVGLVAATALMAAAGGLAHVALAFAVLGRADARGMLAAGALTAAAAGAVSAALAAITSDLGGAALPLLLATLALAAAATAWIPRVTQRGLVAVTPIAVTLAGLIAVVIVTV